MSNQIRDAGDRAELTPAQTKVIAALVGFIHKKGYQPSMYELGRKINLNPSGVHQHLRGIALSGWIRLTGVSRSIIIPPDVLEMFGERIGR